MRILLSATVALLSWSAAVHAQDTPAAARLWPGGSVSAFFGPGLSAYRLTIESENGVVSVIEVPDDVFLGVIASRPPGDGLGDWELPKTVTGTVRIRTRRADELEDGERSADAIMSKAPFELTLRNVSVHIERVGVSRP